MSFLPIMAMWFCVTRAIFQKWDLDFAIVGETIAEDRFLIVHGNETKADLPLSKLSSTAPEYDRPWVPTPKPQALTDVPESTNDAALAHEYVEQTRVGLVFSSDSFYSPRPELVARMTGYGVLAVEMEASALYTLAAEHQARALTICTVSDHVVTGEQTSSEERQQTFGHMVEVALEAMFTPAAG